MSEARTLRAVGVSPGIAYGPAAVLERRFPDVPDRSVTPEEVDQEVERLRLAVEAVVQHLDHLRERVLHSAGLEESQIFEAQILMAQDPDFLASVEHLIRKNKLSAETAYEFKALELRVAFAEAANLRMRERLTDLTAVQIHTLRHLMGRPDDELAAVRR